MKQITKMNKLTSIGKIKVFIPNGLFLGSNNIRSRAKTKQAPLMMPANNIFLYLTQVATKGN